MWFLLGGYNYNPLDLTFDPNFLEHLSSCWLNQPTHLKNMKEYAQVKCSIISEFQIGVENKTYFFETHHRVDFKT